MALCSLSMGMMVTFLSFAALKTSSPATTRVSLLARARFLPALMAAKAGTSPALPTMPETTKSESGQVATFTGPCSPKIISTSRPASCSRTKASFERSKRDATLGLNCLTCSTNFSALLPADNPLISKRSEFLATTSRVLTPIDPVEPRREICFISL